MTMMMLLMMMIDNDDDDNCGGGASTISRPADHQLGPSTKLRIYLRQPSLIRQRLSGGTD
jgi:hypothetical protein